MTTRHPEAADKKCWGSFVLPRLHQSQLKLRHLRTVEQGKVYGRLRYEQRNNGFLDG